MLRRLEGFVQFGSRDLCRSAFLVLRLARGRGAPDNLRVGGQRRSPTRPGRPPGSDWAPAATWGGVGPGPSAASRRTSWRRPSGASPSRSSSSLTLRPSTVLASGSRGPRGGPGPLLSGWTLPQPSSRPSRGPEPARPCPPASTDPSLSALRWREALGPGPRPRRWRTESQDSTCNVRNGRHVRVTD